MTNAHDTKEDTHDAVGVLDEIRNSVRTGMDPLAVVSPYLQNSPIFHFENFWDQWTERQTERAKAGQNRLVPVPTELARWVREHHRPGPCEVNTPLFVNPDSYGPNSDNCRWSRSARRRAMLNAMRDIGKPNAWRPNVALRHCFGTRTAERLCSVTEIVKLMRFVW